jgi:formate hydrogenlyase subunit 4
MNDPTLVECLVLGVIQVLLVLLVAPLLLGITKRVHASSTVVGHVLQPYRDLAMVAEGGGQRKAC